MNAWQPILDVVQRCNAGVSIVLNGILIHLILYRSPKQIGLYKYLMVYISVFELFFSLVEISTMPTFYSQGSSWFVIVDPRRSVLPDGLLTISALLYCISFGTSLAIFSVQFVYRYLVLSGITDDSENLENLDDGTRTLNATRSTQKSDSSSSTWCVKSPRNILIWMGSPVGFACVWGSCCYFFLGRNELVDTKLRRDVLPPYHLFPDDIGFIGAYFRPILENGTRIVNWRNIIGWSVMSSCTVISETLMVVFVVKCYTVIESLISLTTCSSQYKNVQSQLFYALAAQSLIPIVLMQIPGSFVFILTFIEEGNPLLAQVFAVNVTVYLAIDALPTMFIIKSYRKTVIRIMCYCYEKKKKKRSKDRGTQSTNLPLSVIYRTPH